MWNPVFWNLNKIYSNFLDSFLMRQWQKNETNRFSIIFASIVWLKPQLLWPTTSPLIMRVCLAATDLTIITPLKLNILVQHTHDVLLWIAQILPCQTHKNRITDVLLGRTFVPKVHLGLNFFLLKKCNSLLGAYNTN